MIRDLICPLHLVTQKPDIHLRNKWYNKSLAGLRREGRKLYRTWKRMPTKGNHERYLKHQKRYKLAMKQSKRDFVQQHIIESENSTKALFKVARLTSVNSSQDKFIPVNPQVYCEEVAQFFTQKVISIRKTVDNELTSAERCKNTTTLSDIRPPSPCGTPADSTARTAPPAPLKPVWKEFSPVAREDVSAILRKLGPSSSILDPFPTKVICNIQEEILADVTNIVNCSLVSGAVPQSWKAAIITPLLKKQGTDQSNPQNLRPVSQLRLLPRITEAVITKQFQRHLEDNTIPHDLQSGFRPGRGTELAVADIRERLLWRVDRSHPVLLVLLDLSAAFDTIDHSILIHRLQDIGGVEGVALEWFKSFLEDRTQAVKWGDIHSTFAEVPFGVPQGSALSPLLFNVYLRPLATLLEQSGLGFQMYADDIQLVVDLHDDSRDREQLVPCLTQIEDWMRSNKLRLNSAKTELLLIEGRRNEVPPVIPWPPSWGELPTITRQTRDLGMIISHRLDGAAHISATVKACHFHLNQLARLFPVLSIPQRKKVYQAIVGSRVNYGLNLLLGASKKSCFALQKVQNRGIRMIFNLNRRAHLSQRRLQLNWLNISDQMLFKVGTWLWRAFNGLGPKYLQDWITRPRLNPLRRAQYNHLLSQPRFNKKTKGGSTIAAKGVQFWNTLPSEIRASKSLASFKSLLKGHLFKKATSTTSASPRERDIQDTSHKQCKDIQCKPPKDRTQTAGSQEEVTISGSVPMVDSNHPAQSYGVASPELPQRNNAALIHLALRNKRANMTANGGYRPRKVPARAPT